MSTVELEPLKEWGHDSPAITPTEIVVRVKEQTEQALDNYAALPEGPEPCNNKREGYRRVSIMIPLDRALFDQLMNGATGYRAHYCVGIDVGERFNRRLIDAIAPLVVQAENLYGGQF